jgi:hypothetical protein
MEIKGQKAEDGQGSEGGGQGGQNEWMSANHLMIALSNDRDGIG